jgi:hypothetical protein
MGLKNITIPERTISVGKDGEISVRGISLSDLMTIVNVYGPQASMAFAKVQKMKSLDVADVRTLIGTMATEFPDMVAAAMALAADSYDQETVDLLKRIPFHKQIEVIEAIFGLTFSQEGEIKKLMGTLTGMMAEVSGALMEIQTPPSPNGIGASAVQ